MSLPNSLENLISSVIATVNSINQTVGEQVHEFVEKTTVSTGETLASIAANPLVTSLDKVIGLTGLTPFLGQVDANKIQATVNQVKARYPQESSSQIAHRLIVEKTWQGGRLGLITNIIPPIAALFLGIELIATTKLQTEMVYEIAAAYGLDLNAPARRGEILAIFGLSLGADVFKTGLSFVEIIPGIGAVVGASTNAALLYVLGQTACRYYENKSQPQSILEQKVNYDWQIALEQTKIIDCIVTYMIKVSYPQQNWGEILPVVNTVAPDRVEAIKSNLEQPQSLETLLNQLSPDFAPLALARCYEIAKSKGEVTIAEQEILNQIAIKFNLDLSKLQQ
ncbi:hypothetical protein NIES4102_27480 [Chondrocystis sp. NIES-4102]|nr:hypothetical protein NIES4102_27480 [Chondrocystis sp. NIES-4102]